MFYPKERHLQDPAMRRDEDIQYRVHKRQAKELQERLARQEEASNRQNFVKNSTKPCQLPVRISPSELTEDLTSFCHHSVISATNLLVVKPNKVRVIVFEINLASADGVGCCKFLSKLV